MPTIDLDSVIAGFRSRGSSATSGDELAPRGWGDEDWRQLFRFTGIRKIAAGEALIRRGEADRTLFFVLRGSLEVIAQSSDDNCLGPLSKVAAGSVLGEQSFFDGQPRSASAWAVEECDVATMDPDQFETFEQNNPALARELLFTLGRTLATRLRRTTARIAG